MKKRYLFAISLLIIIIASVFIVYINPAIQQSNCNELYNNAKNEFYNFDRNCSIDTDCLMFNSPGLFAECINKNSDTQRFNSLEQKLNSQCPADIGIGSIIVKPNMCKCLNNTCE